MPVGHPKDPVAHAQVLAANREKRAAKREGQPRVKRAYRKKVVLTQKGSGRKVSIELDEINKDFQNKISELEDTVTDLERRYNGAIDSLHEAHDSAADMRRYLFAVLDLVANQK